MSWVCLRAQKNFCLEGLAQFVLVPPQNFWLEGLTEFVIGTIIVLVNYFWNSIYVMGMSEGTKKFLARRLAHIVIVPPKNF